MRQHWEPPSPRYAPPAEGGLYRVFVNHVRALDQRPPSYQPFFNGQLFKPHFSEDLVVGDEWLANFIDDLTADDEGYNFADIKVEILGDAYERFLGKVLRPQGRGAAIEEKPEVRKAGGVYYTPRYIVDYIVEQTVGRQLEGKAPAQVAKLRFLDPACGSGSFLIRVYERVMEHHLRHFTERVREFQARSALDGTPLEKLLRPYAADYYLDAAGNVRLTTRLKRQILQNNVFGVDIDAQAVEVTQLSLYLKMLEGENRESLHHQAKDLFNKEALLPPLDQNIKCGNSLIGSDFSLDPAELVRVNAFDWDVGFEKIMDKGGFDAVVGNPPYGRLLDAAGESYVEKALPGFSAMPDIYIAFTNQALRVLRERGPMAFIVPSAWTGGVAYRSMRETLLAVQVEEVIELPFNVFADAYVDTAIFIASKAPPSADATARCFQYDKKLKLSRITLADKDYEQVPIRLWREDPDRKFVLSAWALELINRLRSNCEYTLEQYCTMRRGVLFKPELLTPTKTSSDSHQYFEGDVYRYRLNFQAQSWVEYGPKMTEWPKDFKWFQGPRILLRRLVNRQQRLMAAFEHRTVITNKNLYSLIPTSVLPVEQRTYALLALINAKLISRLYLCQVSQATKDDFPQVTIQDVLGLPCPKIEINDAKRLAQLAEKQQLLNHKVAEDALSDTERAALQNAIRKTDRDIDQLVYQLYGLTPEEIALVEGTAETADAVTEA